MKSNQIDISFLQTHSLFGGLTNNDLESIIPYFNGKMFKENQYIIKEGKQNDSLYFIIKGKVQVIKKVHISNEKTVDQVLEVFSDGDAFGEMELIEIKSNAASVKAIEATDVIILSNASLIDIKEKNLRIFTIIIWNLARELSRRLRHLDNQIYTPIQK